MLTTIGIILIVLGVILLLVGYFAPGGPPHAINGGWALIVLGIILLIVGWVIDTNPHVGEHDMAIGPLVWAVSQRLRRSVPAFCGSWRN